MKRSSYIADGYSCPGYIKAEDGLYDELRFVFRPALVTERSELIDKQEKLARKLYDVEAAEFMAKKLVSWSLADGAGNGVSVSKRNLLAIHPLQFIRLHAIVLGNMPTDTDPNWAQPTPDSMSVDAAAQIEAELNGTNLGEAQEQQNEKNSQPG